SKPVNFTPLGVNVIFTTQEVSPNSNLWISDGTTAGTHIDTSIPSLIPQNFCELNGKVFFKLSSGIWSTDGTANGTGAITVTLNENSSSTPYQAVKANSNLFVFAVNEGVGRDFEVWRTDGTQSGSFKIFPADPKDFVEPIELCQTSANGMVFFDEVMTV